MLEHFIQLTEPWLEQYGNIAVFGALFLEGIGIPAPGLSFLLASVLLASRGEMHLLPLLLLSVLGFFSGCQLAFLLGRTGGRRLLLRIGLLNRHRLRGLQQLFARWGAPLLMMAPFLDGTRQYSSLVAGTAEMNWRRFTLYNLLGVLLWIGIWSTAIDQFGHHIEPVLQFAHRSAPWLLGTVLVSLIVWKIYRAVLHRYTETG
jgi:membrane protein DedA with SNARE-associated domain